MNEEMIRGSGNVYRDFNVPDAESSDNTVSLTCPP